MATLGFGLVGRKVGMTRVYADDGSATPVTVVEVGPNVVVSVKKPENCNYAAVQLTTGDAGRKSKTNKAMLGHYAKAGVAMGRGLWEFRLRDEASVSEVECGHQYTVELLSKGQKIDVCGRSKGKGFQSGIRRWNFHSQDATHGNSLSHRSNGSIGQCQTPGRVWKGKKMSGHQGDERVTVQGLEVFDIDSKNGALLIKGAIPGANGGDVIIRPSAKIRHTRAATTRPTKGKTASAKPASAKPAGDKPAGDKPAKNKDTGDKPASAQPSDSPSS